MGAIAELPVPQGGAIAALPVPGETVPSQQADTEAFHATSTPFRQGLRSGFNSLGATMNALVGQTGEVLGLTEFANDRFQDAANYVDFANKVAPPIRDYGAVRDATSLSTFVAGMAGQGAASSLPAIGAGLALRRPVAGVMAGGAPFEAGEQVLNLRSDPKVMAEQSPGAILGNAATKGVVNAGIDATLGAESQVLKKVLKPSVKTAAEGFGKAVTKATVGEGVTEGAQNLVGQELHQSLNPDKQIDWHDALNDAMAGASGGGLLGAGGHVAGALPGLAARTSDELRTRLGKKNPPPADEPKLEDIRDDMSVEDIAAMLGAHEEKGEKYVQDVWEKVKNHPTAKKFGDVVTDPDARESFKQEMNQKYSDSEYKPKIDSALATGKKYLAGAKKYLADRQKPGEPEVKKSEMRTSVDDDIHDAMLAAMPTENLQAASDEQLLELSGVIKKMAESPDYFAESGVPQGLRQAFGPAFKGLMETAIERVHAPGPAREDAKEKILGTVKKHEAVEGEQLEEVQNIIRTHMRSEYLAKPDMRKAALEELAPQLLNYVHHVGVTEPFAVKEDGDSEFHSAMKEAFGERTDKVLEALDALHTRAQTNKIFESGTEEVTGRAADARLNAAYDDPAEAHKAREELEAEFGRKNVTINMYTDEGTGKTHLHLESADEMGLDPEAFKRARESVRSNKSGLKEGILTIKTDSHPQGVKINLVRLTGMMMAREGNLLQDTSPKYVADMFKRGIAAMMATEGFRSIKEELEGNTFPDDTKVAVMQGRTYTFGEIKNAGKLTKMDIRGITKESVKLAAGVIQARRESRGQPPLPHAELRKAAIQLATERSHDRAMANTLADRMEMESEDPADFGQFPTLASRDPTDKKGNVKVRTSEEDTHGPVGEAAKPPRTQAGEGKPSAPPHGQGPVSPEGKAAADETTRIRDALNSANPKLEKLDKLQEELRKPISKLSTMNVGKGPQTKEMRQEVREYITRVLGDKKTEVLFKKMRSAGEFAKLDETEVIKISADAADPMSVGYHEAVHALMARLMKADPKAAHVLMRAAGAAPIVARLRELLAGHPEAIKQLEDPEERVAYMYQFWASGHKGLLSIGPNTRTFFDHVKNFFQKIAAIWGDDMNTALATERANTLLVAFHNGDFANRSTVAKVLNEKFPPDPETRLRTLWPAVGNFIDKFVYTANGAVRDIGIQQLTDVMDKFHTLQTDANKAPGFNQVRRVVANRYLNKVVDVIRDMTPEQQAALVEELQSGKDRKTAAAKAIEKINDDLFQYMVDKGVRTWDGKDYVPLKKIEKNYWHRIPNQDYLRTEGGKEAFIAMLRDHGVKDPDATYAMWTKDVDSGTPKEGDAILGISFYTPQLNERKLQGIPDEELAPFLEKDLFGTMSQYIQRAVRRAEYTERFGNRGEVIDAARKSAAEQKATPQQLKTFDASVQAHEGTLGADIDPKLRNTFAALMTYQNIRLLPLQLFSSFVDPLGIMVRGGTVKDAFSGFTRGLRELAGNKDDAAFHLAKTVGSINTAFDENLANGMSGAQYMPKTLRWINDKFFRLNGMESWNRSLRIAATQAAHDFIVRHVESPNKHSQRLLQELNLNPTNVRITDGLLDTNKKEIQDAINKWVDESILTPNAAHRPIYMSDPHWMLISHLKQYSYLFQKVIINRVHHELANGNVSPAFALAGYVPAIIASDMMRIFLTPSSGDDIARKSWTAKDWIMNGVQRAGFFGPGQMAVGSAMDTRQNRIPGQSLLGPTLEQLVDFMRDASMGTGVGNDVRLAVPGAKFVTDGK